MTKHRREFAATATLALITIASTVPVFAQATNQQVRIDSGFEVMLFTHDGEAKMQADPWRERLALVERAIERRAASRVASELGGTAWQLVKFEAGDGTILTPDDKAKYTLAFEADGRVSVRIDCNRGRGTWQSSEPKQLTFGPLALTRAMCPPGSLHDRIVRDWGFVRSYTIKDAHLFLALMADGGIYEFEPLAGAH
jgi:para-nitrobenzyl esterase